jgi:outer membrane protein OmpA-like peptidoglycan-associated protein
MGMFRYNRGFVFIAIVAFLFACENTRLGYREKGALGGAAVGAGLGAIIGNQTGHPGAGVAIGGALGALSGGLIGNELDNQEEYLDKADAKLSAQEREILENKKILNELRARGADVRRTPRGIVVNLPDVLFEFDSARLTSDARHTAREIADVVRQYSNRNIAVEGHTDSIGTDSYNLRLSENRAHAVANELIRNGVSKRRVSVHGFGERQPITSNLSEAGRRRNRRVEVIIENR